MLIILDFDDILFDNTGGLKKALARIFKKHKADFWEIYSKIRTMKGGYSPKKHLALLKKKNKEIDIEEIKKDINKINFKRFLFPGALKLLKKLQDHTLILVSWGDKKFQEKKIYGLGQEFISLFNEIITGPIKKAEVVKKILKSYTSRPIIFVDDKPQEREKIKNKFKDVVVIKNIWQIEKIGQLKI